MNVALTFDDGPSEWTDQILDALAAHHVKATFFVCGRSIDGNEQTVRRIHNDGHQIGNHTDTHPNLQALDLRATFHELADTSLRVREITGHKPAVYRAPYLLNTDAATMVADELGMRHVGCDVIPGDWADDRPLAITDTVVTNTRGGSVILLHDGRPVAQPPHNAGGSLDSREHTVRAVPRILVGLDSRRFRFVTVSQLL